MLENELKGLLSEIVTVMIRIEKIKQYKMDFSVDDIEKINTFHQTLNYYVFCLTELYNDKKNETNE